MTDIIESNTYPPAIKLIELGEPVQGGPAGVDNRAPTQLANRTAWLKSKLEALIIEVTEVDGRVGLALEEVAAQLAGAMTYTTTALGLAGTTDGGYFSVPSAASAEYLILYKNNAGAPVEVKRYPSEQAVKDVANKFGDIDLRSGVMLGFWDLADKLGLCLTTDGKLNVGAFMDVVGHIRALEDRSPEERIDRSGNMAVFLDQLDAVAVAIENDGSLINKGRNILREIDSIKSGAANNKWITPNKNIATFGDSLSDSSYQPFLKNLFPDRNIYVGALSGKKSGQIARLQGGIAPMLSIADNIIPATGPVVVTVDVPFLNNYLQLTGYLYGVYGTLSAVDDVHYFTRSTPGLAVEMDVITPFLQSTVDNDNPFRTAVIWAGNNDFQPAFRPEIDTNVQRMVEFLKPQDKRFIVIGMAIADYPERYKGTPYYLDIMELHKKWRERWPDNFIDITPILQRHYDPTNPVDVQNLIDGCTPSSLRQPGDKVHLNNPGQEIVAQIVANHINQRGW